MSEQSNNIGRAYEFICLETLCREIDAIRPVSLVENSSYHAAHHAWNSVDTSIQDNLIASAEAAVPALFDMEPLILENDDDVLELYIQPDENGETGDVRDIVLVRSQIRWEIGLSLKHNHFAVKHSRLSSHLDFGDRWFGIPCSQNYWDDISPIFSYLAEEKANRTRWSELPAKAEDVYIPLLQAFISEVLRSDANNANLPRRMVEYLLGRFDFYKVICVDREELTRIQAYNFRGALNHPGRNSRPSVFVPISALPTRIVSMGFKPFSDNTVELYMDAGWQFSFRIHNASTYVEPSLKFDVQLLGMPTTVLTVNCIWR